MSINIAGVQNFTDAELLTLYRAALAAVATGQSYSIGGRSLTRADLKSIREMVEWLEQRTNSEDNGGNIALVRFGDQS